MPRYAAIVIAGLCLTASPALAQPLDLAFADIFQTLATQTPPAPDRQFFESQVLKGATGNRVEQTYNPAAIQYAYTYGEAMAGKGANYGEVTDGNEKTLSFYANDFSHAYVKDCVTFQEAEATLKAHGWTTYTGNAFMPASAENIQATVQRKGVKLAISNYEMLLPFIEPWETAEGVKTLREAADKRWVERTQTVRGTEAYANLCVTSVGVSFSQPTVPR